MTTTAQETKHLDETDIEHDESTLPTRREMIGLSAMAVAATALGCGGTDPSPDAGEPVDADRDASDTFPDDADRDNAEDAEDGSDAEADTDGDVEEDAEADAEADGEIGPSPVGPVFLLHLTDTHLLAQDISAPALAYGLGEVMTAVDPDLTVVTGDLVDEGYDEEYWTAYEDTVSASSWDQVMEVPGNHDTHDDFALVNFMHYSITGKATATTYAHRIIEAAGRRVRLVGLNTASAGDYLRNLTGYLDGSQVDDLIASIGADPEPVDATVILGHHPMRGLNGLELHGTAENLRRLIEATDAWAYLFGHVHLYEASWFEGVLHVQAPTLGKPNFLGDPGFCIVALDDDGPVVKRVSLDVVGASVDSPWPQIVITRPVEARAGNPFARSLPRSTPGQVLRAGVFNPSSLDNVSFRIDGGPWQPMRRVSKWYEADLTTTASDSMTLEVQAAATEGVRSESVTVALE